MTEYSEVSQDYKIAAWHHFTRVTNHSQCIVQTLISNPTYITQDISYYSIYLDTIQHTLQNILLHYFSLQLYTHLQASVLRETINVSVIIISLKNY